jgi:hypothetical protein
MLPTSAEDTVALIEEARRQSAEVGQLLGSLSEGAARWRPDETRWSVTGHVAHLSVVNAAYLEAISEAIGRAAVDGPRGEGPYRHPRIAAWFVRSMEPPPRRRIRTFRSMIPDPGVSPSRAADDFDGLQTRMIDLLTRARGLDLGRVRFGSPFASLLRLSLGAGFALLLAHNRRHIWLAREVMALPGFPGPGGMSEGGQGEGAEGG